jgi:hypothetical protein
VLLSKVSVCIAVLIDGGEKKKSVGGAYEEVSVPDGPLSAALTLPHSSTHGALSEPADWATTHGAVPRIAITAPSHMNRGRSTHAGIL